MFLKEAFEVSILNIGRSKYNYKERHHLKGYPQ